MTTITITTSATPTCGLPEDSYGTDEDASPYGSFTLDEIASVFEADGVAAGEPGEGDVCAKGFYTVEPRARFPPACIIWKVPTRSSPTTTCSTGTTAAIQPR